MVSTEEFSVSCVALGPLVLQPDATISTLLLLAAPPKRSRNLRLRRGFSPRTWTSVATIRAFRPGWRTSRTSPLAAGKRVVCQRRAQHVDSLPC